MMEWKVEDRTEQKPEERTAHDNHPAGSLCILRCVKSRPTSVLILLLVYITPSITFDLSCSRLWRRWQECMFTVFDSRRNGPPPDVYFDWLIDWHISVLYLHSSNAFANIPVHLDKRNAPALSLRLILAQGFLEPCMQTACSPLSDQCDHPG